MCIWDLKTDKTGLTPKPIGWDQEWYYSLSNLSASICWISLHMFWAPQRQGPCSNSFPHCLAQSSTLGFHIYLMNQWIKEERERQREGRERTERREGGREWGRKHPFVNISSVGQSMFCAICWMWCSTAEAPVRGPQGFPPGPLPTPDGFPKNFTKIIKVSSEIPWQISVGEQTTNAIAQAIDRGDPTVNVSLHYQKC